MTVVVVIDGVLGEGREPPGDAAMPTFQRLTRQGGRVTWRPEPPWDEEVGVWGELFALTPERHPPLAYWSALGLGLRPDPALTWCCLGFTHLHQRQEKLLFVSHRRTGLGEAEQTELAQAMREELEPEGWTLHGHPALLLLSRQGGQEMTAPPLSGLEGCSLLEVLPQGEGAPLFHRLLTTGQLLLARHPVNQARLRQGRLALNTPWFWGMGQGRQEVPHPPRGRCWSPMPAVAGLAGLRGFAATVVAEEEPLPELRDGVAAMAEGVALIHLASPLLLARHGQWDGWRRRLEAIERELLAPLAQGARPLIVAGGMAVGEDGAPRWSPAPWGRQDGASGRRPPRWSLFPWRGEKETMMSTSCLENWLT